MNIPLRQFWALLSDYLRPQWPKVVLLAVLILSGIGLQLANPQIIRYFIDTAQTDAPLERLLWAGGFFLVGAILLQITTVASTYVGEDIGWTATNQMREDLALHCLRLDMRFHHDHTPGAMIERIDGDVANLAIFFAQFVVRVIGSLLLLFGVLIALAFIDWRISLALAIYASFALWALVRMRNIATPFWKASRESSADLFGFIEEQLSGTEDIRSSGATSFVMRDLFRFNWQRLVIEKQAGVMNTFMVMTWMGLFTLGQVIALGSGAYFYGAGILTIGTVYLLVSYTDAIFRPLEQITDEIQNLQKAAASIDRIQELLNTPAQIIDGTAGLLQTGALGVAFDAVTFSYETANSAPKPAPEPASSAEQLHKQILTNLSFSLAPGEVLGLLGRTGSGKTTITRLLFRLYEPQQGYIRLGSGTTAHDIRAVPLDDLRNKIGIVTQDVQLFKASVRDNLTFFDRSIPDDRILAALEALEMGNWLRALPNGLDSELSSGSAGLSAGEAQLLAFTRVFLRDPGLVILDEASSRLDPATEQRIERAVDTLLQGRTGIIVAHRLATVHRADSILILEEGQIREFGCYRDLVQDADSRFNQLLQAGMEEVLV
ncbi:MAG: ABC transporter ATP-binding protein [Roseiflexaceae bacterium]|nr:ABC transporter ATP-binding protein [Roseiflexaceae bacterium]